MLHAKCVLAVLGLTAAANAQPVETITYSIEWDQGVIGAGETNTGAVYANITPAIGTATAWNTLPGKGQAATLKAFASTIMDVMNLENGTKGTLEWNVPIGLNIALKPGTPDGNGGILGSQAGQFGTPANPTPIVTDKVKILELSWKYDGPGDGFLVKYGTKVISSKVYLDVGLPSWVGENAAKVDGQGEFWVITPTPASLAVLGLGGLVAMRRRRG